MQQGTTLDAEIAECGDIDANPGLTEMMTTYVIFSRVRRANTILLLRAFALRLFQQGCPPGPHCLLKFLRARFTGDSNYTSDKAIEEYNVLAQTWEAFKKQSKKTTMKWTCSSCNQAYPAEGFNARSNVREEIIELCTTPGYWRTCTACTAAGTLRERVQENTSKTCDTCDITRAMVFFDGTDATCLICTLSAEVEETTSIQCAKCQNTLTDKECKSQSAKGPMPLCHTCSHTADISCSICHKTKPATLSSQYARKNNTSIQRCMACSESCAECHKTCTSAQMFATGSNMCWLCYRGKRACSKCLRHFPVEAFDDIHIKDFASKRRKYLLCPACLALGFRGDNIDEIQCRSGHKRGRAAFTKKALNNAQQRGSDPLCITCQSRVQCDRCNTLKDPDEFDIRVLRNASQPGRKAVCLECHDNKRQKTKENEVRDTQTLLRILRQPDAWRCTCKKNRPLAKTKAKSALEGKLHDAKCLLTPNQHGEQRWDRTNKNITLKELRFLADNDLY